MILLDSKGKQGTGVDEDTAHTEKSSKISEDEIIDDKVPAEEEAPTADDPLEEDLPF